jgi:hypothetical protein
VNNKKSRTAVIISVLFLIVVLSIATYIQIHNPIAGIHHAITELTTLIKTEHVVPKSTETLILGQRYKERWKTNAQSIMQKYNIDRVDITIKNNNLGMVLYRRTTIPYQSVFTTGYGFLTPVTWIGVYSNGNTIISPIPLPHVPSIGIGILQILLSFFTWNLFGIAVGYAIMIVIHSLFPNKYQTILELLVAISYFYVLASITNALEVFTYVISKWNIATIVFVVFIMLFSSGFVIGITSVFTKHLVEEWQKQKSERL